MKRKRHFRTIICFVLGVVLLTGSVFANYDNASGYTRLKKGLLKLSTVENVTIEGSMSAAINDKNVNSIIGLVQYNAKGDVSEYTSNEEFGTKNESWYQNGFRISKSSYSDREIGYYVHATEDKGFNYSYINVSEEQKNQQQKEINFLELLADTLVGDLKNNFVLISSKDGVSEYQIDLSRDQIPELIQSGLSLIVGDNYSYSNDGSTFYEDYEKYAEMSDEDSDAIYEETINHFEENDWTGVAYVKADGSIVYYDTYEEFKEVERIEEYEDEMDYSDFFYNLAGDVVLDNAKCNASVGSNGNINSISGSIEFSAIDKNGEKKTLTISGDAKLYDYGTTTINAFDQSILSLDWENAKNSYTSYSFDKNGKLIQYDDYGVEITEVIVDDAA